MCNIKKSSFQLTDWWALPSFQPLTQTSLPQRHSFSHKFFLKKKSVFVGNWFEVVFFFHLCFIFFPLGHSITAHPTETIIGAVQRWYHHLLACQWSRDNRSGRRKQNNPAPPFHRAQSDTFQRAGGACVRNALFLNLKGWGGRDLWLSMVDIFVVFRMKNEPIALRAYVRVHCRIVPAVWWALWDFNLCNPLWKILRVYPEVVEAWYGNQSQYPRIHSFAQTESRAIQLQKSAHCCTTRVPDQHNSSRKLGAHTTSNHISFEPIQCRCTILHMLRMPQRVCWRTQPGFGVDPHEEKMKIHL